MNTPYELLIKYCRKECNQEECIAVENWLKEDDNNFELLLDLKSEWSNLEDDQLVVPDKYLIWNRIQHNINSGHAKKRTKLFSNVSAFNIGLVFLLMLTLANVLFWYNVGRDTSIKQTELSFTKIITNPGDKSKVILSDGTEVWLNSNSSISFDQLFNETNRQISTSGELFLNVAKSQKPFILTSNNIKIEVLGTSFNVSAYDENETIDVSLKEGKITVFDSRNDSLLFNLLPLQQAIIDKKNLSYQLQSTLAEDVSIWTDEYLSIYDSPIDVVCKKLEHWYGVKITYSNMDVNKRYSFLLRKESFTSFIELFSEITPVKYTVDARTIHLIGQK